MVKMFNVFKVMGYVRVSSIFNFEVMDPFFAKFS